MNENDFVVTPWEVSGEIDYDKLIERFGTERVDKKLIARIGKHAKYVHPMLRREIFYSHRDLNWILDEHEKGNGFVLYTGRGPSGDTHLGHLMPWMFTRHLQEVFGAKLLFQLTDDEKFLFNEKLNLEDTRRHAYENALDLIALGFEADKTEIFLDTEYIKTLYRLALKAAKKVTFSTAKAVFGFNNSTNIGSVFFTSVQSAPCFLESERQGKAVPCLIPCAIDQDAHFRVTRDIAEGLGYPKPALVHCKLFPSLAGSDKMSASLPKTSIFTTDSPEVAGAKIKDAFTGGRETVKEQREKGGRPNVCSIYQYFFYVFEDDDARMMERKEACLGGSILCGDCKQELASRVGAFLKSHQKKREKARDVIEDYILRD